MSKKSATKVSKSPVSWTESRISLSTLFIPLSFSLSFYFSVLSAHLNTDDLTGINGIQIQPLFSLSNKCLVGGEVNALGGSRGEKNRNLLPLYFVREQFAIINSS